MIKAIIFDWGGVLIDETLGKMDNYCADVLCVNVENYNIARQESFNDFAHGDITEHEFWHRVCNKLNVDIPNMESLWGDAVEEAFNEKLEMFALMDKLKRQGYKIGFLSNTEMPAVKYWKRNEYEKYFDAVVFSCVEHIAKPEKEIYELICERLGVSPKEAVFIDDKKTYVDGAINVGLQGVVFENVEQIQHDLKQLLN